MPLTPMNLSSYRATGWSDDPRRSGSRPKVHYPAPLWMLWMLPVLVFTPLNAEAARTSAHLLLFDQCIASDHPVWLRARLVSGRGFLFRSAISGERIQFRVNGQSIGPVLTGGDGVAMARYTPPKPGTYAVKAILVDNPRYEAPEAEAMLLYGMLGRRVIVVSLEAIRTLTKPRRFPFFPSRPQEPMPKATGVLNDLAKKYQLIYIQGGDEIQLPEIRDWLEQEDFPKGPLFVWRLSDIPETRTEQVIEETGRFKAVGRLFLGITRSPAEARAFYSLGMQAVVLSEDEEPEVPEGAEIITDWDMFPF